MKARIIFSLAMVFVLVGCATHTYTPPSVDYFQRGGKYINEKNYNLAIRDYTEAIRRNQNKAAAYGNALPSFRGA